MLAFPSPSTGAAGAREAARGARRRRGVLMRSVGRDALFSLAALLVSAILVQARFSSSG